VKGGYGPVKVLSREEIAELEAAGAITPVNTIKECSFKPRIFTHDESPPYRNYYPGYRQRRFEG
jgi:hypothetical protein